MQLFRNCVDRRVLVDSATIASEEGLMVEAVIDVVDRPYSRVNKKGNDYDRLLVSRPNPNGIAAAADCSGCGLFDRQAAPGNSQPFKNSAGGVHVLGMGREGRPGYIR